MKTEPNNAMVPTPVNVTVPANAGPAPFTSVAHLWRSAKLFPAMKNNIISAIILAIAILGVAILQQRASTGVINQFMSQLENAAVAKDASGKTQITKIVEGFSKSASEGMSGGFSAASTDKKMKDFETADKIVIKEIKIVAGSNKNKEKVIGIIKNESAFIVSDVNFNYMNSFE